MIDSTPYHSGHVTTRKRISDMQIAAATAPTTTAPTTPTTSPVAAASHGDRNPWGFPRLDSGVARQALDAFEAAERTVNHLIDRSIAVRVQLDRDLRAGTYASDTVRAVELLTRARDYAIGTLEQRHFTRDLQMKLHAWTQANPEDARIRVVSADISQVERAVQDLLDDDEGNVREEIANMREQPGRRSYQAVRDSLDGSIAALYESREMSGSAHVLRAAGNLG